jgi:MGT family glycosyltransferase
MAPLPTIERAGESVAELYRTVGLEPDRYGGAFRGLYVDIVPPALDGDRPLGPSIRLRPQLEPADPPAWLGELLRPLVYATLGTVFNTPASFRPLLDALGEAEVGALVTVGRDVDPTELGAVPPNVRVERFVPQAQVLPAASVVISHGGSGTLLGTLAAGVPLVLVPQGANQFENAMRCERIGVAANVAPGEPIAPALAAVLAEPRYSEAAQRVRAEIEQMPTPEEVAEAVEEHVARG